jgi:hypothetical protein
MRGILSCSDSESELRNRTGLARQKSRVTFPEVWLVGLHYRPFGEIQTGENMKTFEVSFRYQGRNNSSEGSTVKVDASSLPGAVAKATREFVKALDRKQRFDMNKNGLEIKAVSASGGAAKEGGGPEEASS